MTHPDRLDRDRAVPLTLRADLLDQGYTRDDIKHRLGRRELIAVRPGVYVPSAELKSLGERERHVLQIEATMRQLGPGALVSHQSAACPLGITPLRTPTAVQARHLEQSVVAADSALRRGLVTRDDLQDAIRRARRRPGVVPRSGWCGSPMRALRARVSR